MADEININLAVACAKANWKFNRALRQDYDQATAGHYSNVQSVGTTHEALAVPADMSTKGLILIINHDTTNYVDVGRDVAAAFVETARIPPGYPYLAYVPAGVTLYVKANTSTCLIETSILSA